MEFLAYTIEGTTIEGAIAMKRYKAILVVLICYILGAAFQTLSLKADIGVCAVWDCVGLNLAQIFGIKVGYVSIAGNCFLVLLQFLLLRTHFHPARLLQIPMAFLFGFAVNFFYYRVFTFTLSSYAMRLALCMLSYVGIAVFIGVVTYMNLVQTPAEGFCYILEETTGIPFRISRSSLDLLCMAASVTLTLLFHSGLKVREGTVIGMLLLGPMMGACMHFYAKHDLRGHITHG